MSNDLDDCEEWCGWVDIPPKRVVRVIGRVRRIGHMPMLPIDPETDARIEALARAHEPTTGAKTPLTRKEAGALLDEGKRIADEKRRERLRRERDPERCQ